MSRLTDLLRAAKQLDPQLGEDLEAEIQPLQKRLPFGLNFERHAPEAVELAGHKIRKGSKVRVLPPRGSTVSRDQRIWVVTSIRGTSAEVATPNGEAVETVTVQLDDLILVAEFRDRIYPGLRPDGFVEHGRDKPFHTVINGENFHVLEQLTFTHEQSVDAIYIDPPYNTGARDWKYNNNYVEDDDLYRHSKWLAFMERRLRIAKRLLNPDNSVLITAIDENEHPRLLLLLEQLFPEAKITSSSVSINPKGTPEHGFSRVDEFLVFVMIGDASPVRVFDPMLGPEPSADSVRVRWRGLTRTGANGVRTKSPGAYFPIFVRLSDGSIHSSGNVPPLDDDGSSVQPPTGTVAVWPTPRRNGDLGRWSVIKETFDELLALGAVKTGRVRPDKGEFPLWYLTDPALEKIKSGEIVVTGRDAQGAMVVEWADASNRKSAPRTLWNRASHSASEHGTGTLGKLLPGVSFDFCKSLYAVEDALRLFVADKPGAVVLDFFAGSGTTAHAVMRLNRQDDGHRQCISVTNNEVSDSEQTILRKQGLRPGDSEWERLGICDYITKPRLRAAITGKTPANEAIVGDYKFFDEFPMADGFQENAAFFTLTYESQWRISTDRAFAAIAPMLWLRAGAVGRRIDAFSSGWEVADSYGIINDLDRSYEFIAALQVAEGIRIVYIVTDDDGRYQQVANEIPGIETVRLYEDYLRNCESVGDF